MRALRCAFGAGAAGFVAWGVACSGPETETRPTDSIYGTAIGDTPGHASTGRVGMHLTIGSNVDIHSLSWNISNGVHTYTGTVAIGAAQSVEFVAGGIAAGSGYVVTLTGADTNGDPCTGMSSALSVTASATTAAIVLVTCTVATDATLASEVGTGNLAVDAGVTLVNQAPFLCPGITGVSISPAEVLPPETAALGSTSTSGAGGSKTLLWTSSCGTIANPTSDNATFSCGPAIGLCTVTLTVGLNGLGLDGGSVGQVCTGLANTSVTETINCEAASADAGVCGDAAYGTGCGDGGQICNAIGACVPAVFSVLRLGDGVLNLTTNGNNSAPLFVEQHDIAGAMVGAPIALPTAASGANSPCTLMGTATTEGDLTLSVDGRYLSAVGWAIAPASVVQNVSSVVARIDSTGNVDTATLLGGAFTGGNKANARSVVTTNGGAFWVGGTSSSTAVPGNTGGVWYVPFHADAGAQLLALPNGAISGKMRWARIFGGQLYGSSDQAPPYMFTLGSGLPTSGSPLLTELPGFPAEGGIAATVSPYAYQLFDLLPSVPGPDTLYIADDRTKAGQGGVSKWTFDGANWKLAWTISAGTTDAGAADAGTTVGFRGMAGFATGSLVTLMASTSSAQANSNQLAIIMDNGVSPPTVSLVASAPGNEVFRGVALSPHN